MPLVPTNGHAPLAEALKTYDRHGRRRFHVPAHAGHSLWGSKCPDLYADLWNNPFRYDLTELDGLDVLSEPSGPIAESQGLIAEQFGVRDSFMLVNGASVGLIAAMLCVVQPGQKVLLPRNVHRSVLSGLILSGAHPVWFLPERLCDWGLWGAVTLEQVQAQVMLHPDAKALFVTSPTYEGIGSDIAVIAEFCRSQGVLLVVDEAHGSLWPLTEVLPRSACHTKADVVIHSLHKSGGSLTQGALAHLPQHSRIPAEVFQQALNTLQTTSPSYLLMASLDTACAYLRGEAGQSRIAELLAQVQQLRGKAFGSLTALKLFKPTLETAHLWDPCKFYWQHPNRTGEDWGAYCEEAHRVAYESASPSGVLYLANLGLREPDFADFREIFLEEDKIAAQSMAVPFGRGQTKDEVSVLVPEMALSPRDAFFAPGEKCSVDRGLIGRVAKETVVHCPPGIPILFPGERIQAWHLPILPESGVLVVF